MLDLWGLRSPGGWTLIVPTLVPVCSESWDRIVMRKRNDGNDWEISVGSLVLTVSVDRIGTDAYTISLS